jgi:hypothetical protein
MKKFLPLLLAAVLAVSMLGITTVSAASATVSFKGSSTVVAGGTYTYSIYVNLSGAFGAMGNISCSGV